MTNAIWAIFVCLKNLISYKRVVETTPDTSVLTRRVITIGHLVVVRTIVTFGTVVCGYCVARTGPTSCACFVVALRTGNNFVTGVTGRATGLPRFFDPFFMIGSRGFLSNLLLV
jgi:hypothetical protein